MGTNLQDLKLYPWTRQFTGQAWRFRAYVKSRATGEVVAACHHIHRALRGSTQTLNGREFVSGGVSAQRCAERMLAAIECGRLPDEEWTDEGRRLVKRSGNRAGLGARP